MLSNIIWGVSLLLVGALIAVRTLPTDPARWHQPVRGDENADYDGAALRVLEAEPDHLQRIDDIAMGWPRTKRIAGSVEEGRITYATRTFWIGFPDYTTVEYTDGKLKLFARLRFGQKDFGVNRSRVESWVSQL